MSIEIYFRKWCKETGRSGGVLLGSSIREFFKWYSEQVNKECAHPNKFSSNQKYDYCNDCGKYID